jgi:hypothetical protein
MLTMLYKIKIVYIFKIHLIGANVMLAASQISLGSLLLVNHCIKNNITSKIKFHFIIIPIQKI